MNNPQGDSGTVLEVEDLRVEFATNPPVRAVRGVSFSLSRGEKLGIVGESGCGKSVTATALLGMVDPPGRIVSGSVRVGDTEMISASPSDLRSVRGSEIAMVFQDPMSSLNPVARVGRQIEDVLTYHGWDDREARQGRVVELLTRVGLPDPARRARAYPHELSGGMRQRVMIAMALANDPTVLVADEPTTALDVTVEAQVLLLLEELASRTGAAIVLISHDLRVVSEVCDRVLVFYAGRIVEQGPTDRVFSTPSHPYTRALTDLAFGTGTRRRAIQGSPPDLAAPIDGCPFAPRCDLRTGTCDREPLLEGPAHHRVACWFGGPR